MTDSEGRACDPESVTAVIVTFHPDLKRLECLLASLHQCGEVIVVDNTPSEVFDHKLLSPVLSRSNVSFVPLGSNQGIAAAQNLGVRVAQEHRPFRCQAIWLLDQDSEPMPDCLDRLCAAAMQLDRGNEPWAAVGPHLCDRQTGRLHGFHQLRWFATTRLREQSEDLIPVRQINSSGTLIPVRAWAEVGGCLESLFIDHVETEWCFRAVHKGYSLYGAPRAIMVHSMGDKTIELKFGFWRFMQPYRRPLRHYYIFRNSLALQRMPHVPRAWKWQNCVKLLFTFLMYQLIDREERNAQRMFMLQGMRAGVRGDKGEYADK